MKAVLLAVAAVVMLAIASEANACHGQRAFFVQSAPSCGYYAASADVVFLPPSRSFAFQSRGRAPAAFQFQAAPGDKVRFRQGPFGGTSLRIN